MNQIARTDDRIFAIENRINQQVSSAISVGTGGISFQNAGEVMEYAKMMAVSGSAVPKHLRGQPGACLGIIDDAIRFQTSPYALARKSYFVNDNLAYEAQVLAGIVNAHAPLKQRPQIVYEGEGSDRVCVVTGEFRDGAVREYRSPAIGKITPKNSPLWKNDPDQQLAYYSLRGFARRHCPEILLGIYDVEEMRSIDHGDDEPRPSLADRLAKARQEQAAEPQDAREGFDADFVARETESLTSGAAIEQEPSDPASPLPIDVGDDSGSGPDQAGVVADNPADEAEQEDGAVESETPADPAPSSTNHAGRAECVRKLLAIVGNKDLTKEQAAENLAEAADMWAGHLDDMSFVKTVFETARKVLKGELQRDAAEKYLDGIIETAALKGGRA